MNWECPNLFLVRQSIGILWAKMMAILDNNMKGKVMALGVGSSRLKQALGIKAREDTQK